jgi:hypothetical protein
MQGGGEEGGGGQEGGEVHWYGYNTRLYESSFIWGNKWIFLRKIKIKIGIIADGLA